ncbi:MULTISPECIES: P-loop NTPase family protein [Streptomyces]|uniref:Uncharacterized protein n=1 Tax=Streptomyces edwardsiae TaxID=3075527 RepID=A0ABU2QMJ3_9ACTN|nr:MULTISPECIES: hypothetical protein [unclassified Streptomyces]MDT0405687.1 hypothetical protein [Streptomyces sp. DSM 41635]
MTASHTLATEDLTLGHGGRAVVEGLDPTLAAGRITVIVGADARGNSTAQDDAPVAAALKATHTTGLHRTRGTTVVMMDSRVVECPGSGEPLVLPIGRHHSRVAGSGIAAAGSR